MNMPEELTCVKNNKVHLCASCGHIYPICLSGIEDVLFGEGVGKDNICCCSKYEPITCNEPLGSTFKNKLMMYLADLELAYSPGCGKIDGGDTKIYEFVKGLSEEIATWETVPPKESHTSQWHDLIKDPTDLPEMQDAGILKSLGIKMISDQCFATILCDDGTRIVDVSAHLRDGKWHTDTGRWINVSGHKSEVVAWMPVIEPYRPEERKDGEANAEYRD